MQYVCTNRAVLAAIGTNLLSCRLLYAAKRADENTSLSDDVWLCCDRLTVPKYLMCIFITCGGEDSHSSVTQLQEDNKGAVGSVLSGIHMAIIFAACKLN